MGNERDPVLSNTGRSPSGTALEGLCVEEPYTEATAAARELLPVGDGDLVADALPDCVPLGTAVTASDCELEGSCDAV